MKTIGEIRHSQIVSGEQDKDASHFSHRRAARAILASPAGAIALLYVGSRKCHKLPGGGIEGDENSAEALARELLEETGCQATITREVGQIVEYRDEWDQKQTSECFLATQNGEIGQPQFTEQEQSDGFMLIWTANVDLAITLLESDSPQDYAGKFIRQRDLMFLSAARELPLS
jgi:ADP-ribose pyrophosphatase YjhB (NUDIX family)